MDPVTEPAHSAEELRALMVELLQAELVGPAPGFPAIQTNREEILRPQDPPRMRYGAGILFPLKAATDGQNDAEGVEGAATVDFSKEESAGDEDFGKMVDRTPRRQDVDNDPGVNLANEFLPSALGLSALVELPEEVRVQVTAATYFDRDLPGQSRRTEGERPAPATHHCRKPLEVEVVFSREELAGSVARIQKREVQVDGVRVPLCVHILSRPHTPVEGGGPVSLITVTLINTQVAQSERPKDEECFFQCSLRVVLPGGEGRFLDYPEAPGTPSDEEEASLRLLYRHRKVLAVGHGCAPGWPERRSDDEAIREVWTEVVPVYEVRPVQPSSIPGLELSMSTLGWAPEKAAVLCNRLADAYEEWIEEQEGEIAAGVPADLQAAAWNHMTRCRECLSRIRAGVSLIENDGRVREAFSLMNRAMLMQQIHYQLSSEHKRRWVPRGKLLELERPFEAPRYEDARQWRVAKPERIGKWRPFQLAFVLMNLRSLSDPSCSEREIVDLIWFPTGGGKTEAYLGLTAFAILHRRLNRPDNAGTTVLMRYTLRLLTAQQYQRAASLICALESLRRGAGERLGRKPISIGLWAGGDVTPNNHRDALDSFGKLLRGERSNPFIVLSCPWCGAQMGPVRNGNRTECKGYRKEMNPARVRFVCEDPDCDFAGPEGLPLQVVDDAIYEEPPSLVVGTVDKFALLPFRPEARSLFGLTPDGACDPPDLIVQDELHLISGPLGSMVGHYETVIDLLCERSASGQRRPAKVVASTATISRAQEQIEAVYGREESVLFPPQGLRAGQSFFAFENEKAQGRLYVGVFATALPSHVTAQVRVLSALLQAVRTAGAEPEAVRDPYWTLVVYFNSLRELGHAATLLRADIREYLNAVWDRQGLMWSRDERKEDRRRFINHALELTSRISNHEIPEALEELFNSYGAEEARAVDVCLATNMIQVGLDVPRLGLMAVVGQPKTTSEYIQATSRVGRRDPGLVVTVYNPSRPRDRSHYEHFRAYHQSLYRYVEPTSVTPFAIPVRERALHALLISLVRYWGNEAERAFPSPAPRDALFRRVKDAIMKRVQKVPQIDAEEVDETSRHLDYIIERWKAVPPPRYGDFAVPSEEVPLMYPAGGQRLPQWLDRSYATPTSMRNVDASCEARPVASYPTVS